MIYEPAVTAAILDAMNAIAMANNGYADIGTDPVVAEALGAAGYVVIATRDLSGRAVYRGFTKTAQAALAVSPFGVSTYKPVERRVDGPDYEAAILSRQERAGYFD